MNDAEISLAAIALAGTAVAGIIWIAKYAVKQLKGAIEQNARAAVQQAKASDRSASAAVDLKKSVDNSVAVSAELHTFMKSLNGKLAKATIQTVKEQNVEHQTVNNTTITDGK